MKKNVLAAVSSITILAVLAVGLYFWAFYPKETQTENKENHAESPSSEQAVENEGNNAESSGEELKRETQEEEQEKDVTLVFAGDIYLSPYVQQNYDSGGISGVVSESLLEEMKNADITMANLEFPFSTGGEAAADKQFTFRVAPSYASVLTDMGVDVVTAANNHALDYGKQALTDTFDTLDSSGVAYVGAGADRDRAMQPYLVQEGSKTFGFLGASRVIPEVGWNIENGQPGMLCTYDSTLLCEAIRKADEQCDFVTVYVHWGIERENTPQEYQRQLAKAYIDAGADLVIGAHPHVLQGIEYYNGKPIVYSLGNYIFNQEIASTLLLKVTVSPEGVAALYLMPAYAADAMTQERSGEKAAELYQFMENISFGIHVGEDGAVSESKEML